MPATPVEPEVPFLIEEGTFFVPGPTEVHPDVLAAQARPLLAHRSAEFEALVGRAQVGLQAVLGTEQPVVVSTSSATGLMETGVRSSGVHRVLCLVNGAFSDRFAKIAESHGLDVVRFEVPWGMAHDPDAVEDEVRRYHPELVTMVHSETSTGVLNPVPQLVAAVRAASPDVLTVVDSVSGAGGVHVDPDGWGVDFLLTGSQKAMAMPPGLAFGVASERFEALTKEQANRGFYFDLARLVDGARKNRPSTTPAISLFNALEEQMKRVRDEGVPSRFARHLEMANLVHTWVASEGEALGAEVLAPEGFRSPTVTAIQLGTDPGPVLSRLRDKGFTLGAGYGPLKPKTLRVGHMGDHTPHGVRRVLGALKSALSPTGG